MPKGEKNVNRFSTLAAIYILEALITVLAATLTLTTCKPMFLQDIAGYVPVYSQVVGPDGGTVTDSRGASVEIPAGALAEATTITIATYEDGGGIYSRHGVTPFTGGADFGPDGIEFLKPVTITLPTSRKMVPGQTQPLFMQNPATGAWDMTDFTLTASEDGYSATAEVTHFTPYVSSLLPPGALSKIEEFFDGTNGQVALGSYMAWFLTATNLYGFTTECSNSVYEVVGLFFDFTWQVDGNSGTAVSEYGDVSLDTVAQLNYSYDTASTAGPEYIYNMLVTVYFDVTENPPEADPNISILEPVPGSTVEGIETISTYIVTGDSDTDIDSVAFYADGALLGSDTEAPFQWYWDTDSLADGEHTLTATAAFSGGESVESEAVTVVVGDGEEEPNPELGAWQSTTALTQARVGHTSAVYNGYIYVLGGSFNNGSDWSYYNDVQYASINADGSLGAWQSTTPFEQERRNFSTVVYNGYLYVLGGYYTDVSTSYYYNDVQYAPINADGSIGAWQSTASFSQARNLHTSVVHNGYVYVLGGMYHDGSTSYYYNDVQYAPINADGSLGAWQFGTSFSIERSSHTTIIQNGYIYILGGWDASGWYNDVQYAPITIDGSIGTWQSTVSFPNERMAHTSVVNNDFVYILGGTASGYQEINDVQYAPINLNGSIGGWQTTNPLSIARGLHSSVTYDCYVYVLGGVYNDGSEFHYLNDVQYAKIGGQ